MTVPAQIKNHIHITEREGAHVWPDGRKDDASWEDCGYTSLIMFLRLAYRPDLPATHAFVEKIRARIEGPLGGSNPAELAAAAKTIGRSGAGTPGIVLVGASASKVWDVLKPGTVMLANGSMGAFASGYTLRRWDPGFAGGHSTMVARVDDQDRVWWDDPLAPTGTYQGQWVSKADFLKFINKWGSTSFYAPIKGYVAPVVTPPVVTPPPVDTSPFTQADIDAAHAAGKAEGITAEHERFVTAIMNAVKAL